MVAAACRNHFLAFDRERFGHKHLVRYYGALGPNAPLRPLLVDAALARSSEGASARIGRALKRITKAMSASARAWAKLLSRVFEVDPLVCIRCGDRMEPVAAILSDQSLVRLLTRLELPTEFPVLIPARSPPINFPEEAQVDAREGLISSIEWIPPDDFVAEKQETYGA